mmetsp:Transcript_90715/g.234234  ORF Transcript_90715/g.234234 Transcript_90715/m.234234 type:complete len:238 (-) Transcript_90715:332-1045(-)
MPRHPGEGLRSARLVRQQPGEPHAAPHPAAGPHRAGAAAHGAVPHALATGAGPDELADDARVGADPHLNIVVCLRNRWHGVSPPRPRDRGRPVRARAAGHVQRERRPKLREPGLHDAHASAGPHAGQRRQHLPAYRAVEAVAAGLLHQLYLAGVHRPHEPRDGHHGRVCPLAGVRGERREEEGDGGQAEKDDREALAPVPRLGRRRIGLAATRGADVRARGGAGGPARGDQQSRQQR